jgi:hypothetical protein
LGGLLAVLTAILACGYTLIGSYVDSVSILPREMRDQHEGTGDRISFSRRSFVPLALSFDYVQRKLIGITDTRTLRWPA